jgi:hypothetical protein
MSTSAFTQMLSPAGGAGEKFFSQRHSRRKIADAAGKFNCGVWNPTDQCAEGATEISPGLVAVRKRLP